MPRKGGTKKGAQPTTTTITVPVVPNAPQPQRAPPKCTVPRLLLVSSSPAAVQISWCLATDGTNISEYVVYCWLANKNKTTTEDEQQLELGRTSGDVREYTAEKLVPEQTYRFAVAAINEVSHPVLFLNKKRIVYNCI